MEELRLNVAATARRLGIAPATLRTWDRRYGLGPSDHIPGRHRRYSVDDISRLEMMQHALIRGAAPADAARWAQAAVLPAGSPGTGSSGYEPVTDGAVQAEHVGPAPARLQPAGTDSRSRTDTAAQPRSGGSDPGGAGAGEPDPRRTRAGKARTGKVAGVVAEPGRVGTPVDRPKTRARGPYLRMPGAGLRARGLGRAAAALDVVTVRTLLAEAVETAGVESAWNDVARPVLVAVAERWAYTGAGIEVEHLLSECVIGVFSGHAARASRHSDVRPVLVAALPGELHTLPMIVLSAILADRGVPCRPLGPNLPGEALVSAVRRTAPSAVVLWSQLPATADVEVVASLPRTRPPFRTFVAGPGWAGMDLPPRVVHLTSLGAADAAIGAAVLV